MALSLRRALGLQRGGRGVDEEAGAAIGRPGRDEVARGPVRRDPPRRASCLARIPRPVHSSGNRRLVADGVHFYLQLTDRNAPRSPPAEPVSGSMPVLLPYFGVLGNHRFRGRAPRGISVITQVDTLTFRQNADF
jgi:hypothetical protein